MSYARFCDSRSRRKIEPARSSVGFRRARFSGFGFSFLFSDTLQFAGGHLFSSLLAFNVGVELGQILVLILVIPLLRILFRFFVQERVGTILLSALVAHSAWHWMLDRGNTLAQFQMQMPILDSIFFAGLMRWGMMLIVIGLALWAMYELFRRFSLVENMASYGESRDAES